jgi:hypothetical protein
MPRYQPWPKGPPRFRENRNDPNEGEGPFCHLISERPAEQVNPNGLAWEQGHYGFANDEPTTAKYPPADDFRPVGNRSGNKSGQGGYNIVNGMVPDCRGEGGNRSGE